MLIAHGRDTPGSYYHGSVSRAGFFMDNECIHEFRCVLLERLRLRETFAVEQDSGAAGRWPSAVTPTLAVAARGGRRQGNPSGERRFGVGFRAEDESTPRDAQGSYTYEVRF